MDQRAEQVEHEVRYRSRVGREALLRRVAEQALVRGVLEQVPGDRPGARWVAQGAFGDAVAARDEAVVVAEVAAALDSYDLAAVQALRRRAQRPLGARD